MLPDGLTLTDLAWALVAGIAAALLFLLIRGPDD